MKNIRESIGENVPSSANLAVKAIVVENLKLLIPEGYEADVTKMNILNLAVNQLCRAEKTELIDWLALNNLASNILNFWSGDWLEN